MVPRKLRKYLAIIAGTLAAGIPLAVIHFGLNAYIEHKATDDVRVAAQRAIARAEWRIGQSISALAAIGKEGLASCADVDLLAIRRALIATTPLKEIALKDEAGNPKCQELTGATRARALSRDLRTADDRVLLSVVKQIDLNERALRITWHRAGQPLQLVAHIPADVFLPDGSSGRAAGSPAVRLMLSEGTLIAVPEDRLDLGQESDEIEAQNQSTRYPVTASASVSRTAAFAEHADLRRIGQIIGGMLALLTFALAILIPRRDRSNPIVEMERALDANEFVPYYQPIVDLRGGTIVGAEVLMRWRKSDGTIVPPAAFIPLAESSGLIMDMTRAIMRAARDEFAPVLGPRPSVKLGFNLTANHFKNEAVVEEVRGIFADSPIRFSQVILEITEREPLENLDMARHVIAALQELGCSVAIDDVGTGHGGLSYLLKLGANCIKIDKMFIDAIGTERYSTPIIETLVELANRMRMEVCAEGVEALDQVKYLRDRGIFLAQGYAFARPLPGRQFRELLEAAHPLTAAEAEFSAIADAFMAGRSAA
ncbi:MAG: EAL domain-containing protein [Xanthobacteraceae bacterium]